MRAEATVLTVSLLAMALTIARPSRAHAGGSEGEKARTSHVFRSDTGVDVHVGLATTLVRIRTTRVATSLARDRDYAIDARPFASQYGLQLSIDPDVVPFAADNQLDDGNRFQFISVTLLAMVTIPTDGAPAEQTEVALGLGFSFFERTIGFALTFDLYRGIPVAAPGGGQTTAFTGLLGWAFAPEGEVTLENVAFIVTLDLTSLASVFGVSR